MLYGSSPYGSLPYGARPPGAAAAAAAAASERILFLTTFAVDAATLLASTSEGALLVTNLQNRQPSKKWRSTSTAARITMVSPTPVDADSLAFVGHNLTSNALGRVTASIDLADLVSAPDFDTGWKSMWPTSGKPTIVDWPNWIALLRWTNVSSFFNWQLEIVDPGNSDGYVEGGRIAICRGFQPSANVDVSLAIGLEPPSEQRRTPFGFTFSDDRGDTPRRFTLPFSVMNDRNVFDGLKEIQRRAGLHADVMVFLDPAATTNFHEYALHGLFAAPGGYESQPLWDSVSQVWRTGAVLTELL